MELEVIEKAVIEKIGVVHRVGDLRTDENSITIAISTPHSKDEFKDWAQ